MIFMNDEQSVSASTAYRPMMTVTRPYRPAHSQDSNLTKAPLSPSSVTLANSSSRPHNQQIYTNSRPTFVTKPSGVRPGPKPHMSNSGHHYHQHQQSQSQQGSSHGGQQRPLLATSPSNKISSSPSNVGGPQRGTARPAASITINDIEPQPSIGIGNFFLFFAYIFFINIWIFRVFVCQSVNRWLLHLFSVFMKFCWENWVFKTIFRN